MIRNLKLEDKKDIIKITYYLWNKEADFSDRLKEVIYPFLVNYYFYINGLSFVSINDNKLDAFVLGKTKDETNNAKQKFIKELNSLDSIDKENGMKYLNYIEYNTNKVNEFVKENDCIYLLIASIKHNEGTKLLDTIINKSNELGFESAYFWTDETCNYKYYLEKGYKLVSEYYQDFYGKKIKTFIYKIELKKRDKSHFINNL